MTLQEALPFLGLRLVIAKGGWVTSLGLQFVICKNQSIEKFPSVVVLWLSGLASACPWQSWPSHLCLCVILPLDHWAFY